MLYAIEISAFLPDHVLHRPKSNSEPDAVDYPALRGRCALAAEFCAA